MLNATDTADQKHAADTPAAGAVSWSRPGLRGGIAAKLLLATSCGLLATLIVFGGIVYRTLSTRIIEQQEELLLNESRFGATQFSTFLQTLRRDLQLLVTLPAASGLVRAMANGNGIDPIGDVSARHWNSVLAAALHGALLAKPGYESIRLLAADGSNLKFGPVASTEMFCQDRMDTESAFFKALGNTRTFKISGDNLFLSDSAKTVVAKFEVVYMN